MEEMSGRWVCLGCYASNEAAPESCEQCGLARGAAPANAAAAAAPQRKTPGWRSLLRYAWVVVVLGALVVGWWASAKRDSSGQVTTAGDLQVNDLRVGDCFDPKGDIGESTELSDVTAKPCTEPHRFEVYEVATLPDGDFPSDAAFGDAIDANCIPAFADYVGTDFQSSQLDVWPIVPVKDGWDSGDHSLTCVIAGPDLGELTGSMKGARR
jgi:hypothetical protein